MSSTPKQEKILYVCDEDGSNVRRLDEQGIRQETRAAVLKEVREEIEKLKKNDVYEPREAYHPGDEIRQITEIDLKKVKYYGYNRAISDFIEILKKKG